MKIAGAPISWGVCEVPGWGYQLAADRVLREMHDVGLTATEFGPEGFLPADPAAKADLLARYGLAAVGGFVPVVAHEPGHDPLPEVDAVLDGFVAAGADMLVLAAATGLDGYDERPQLDEDGWKTLCGNLDRLAALAAERGVHACLHPHVGTMIETRDDVYRLLDGARIPLCLDTGHLFVGGADPAALAREVPERVAHTHLKDVDARLAESVRAGERTYTEAVREGIYRPLGCGDVDIAGIVHTLEAHGYQGWYVMEQDTVLVAEPDGAGPRADVASSVAYLRSLQ
ncbi:MAG TPA: sugar phosphate isomerase/epimerase [Actinocrinis sp.]|uniref:sugar phosphate isomerase/epimerase family protein n=1 Tax=Actinocrinis sp. TaxID=1920516 RepID=UPI002DDCEBD0|nr:sugar phosphate isomerase/epimerase [Actinocrinis sp.]HEV3173046.1 sugar phosphate isomerase/epimerase [Actinocrinis sp.]